MGGPSGSAALAGAAITASDPRTEVRPVCVRTPARPDAFKRAFICTGQQRLRFLFVFSSGQMVSAAWPGELVALWM